MGAINIKTKSIALLIAVSVLFHSLMFNTFIAPVLRYRPISYSQNHKEASSQRDKNNTLSDTQIMLQSVERERDKLVARLKVDYGEEYYNGLFFDENGTSIGRAAFHSPNRSSDISRQRYIRKMMMKVLRVQLTAQQDATGKMSDCPSCDGDAGSTLPDGDKVLSGPIETFVWVNGGHSTAAAHGNLFSESYTAVLVNAVQNAYATVGINFVGRNYAMGGMQSAPEIALCNEAIFGMDADLITWNFGLTDGTKWSKTLLYGHRRGVHRNRPLLLDLDLGTSYGDVQISSPSSDAVTGSNVRLKMLQDLEEDGLATMYMSLNPLNDPRVKQVIPDMQTITNETEMNEVPEYLRYFRCGDRLENGDPFCGDNKYSNKCTRMKAGWHPGWKVHALQGNMIAIFMVELLVDALRTLADRETSSLDKAELLKNLQQEENDDYDRFLSSATPSEVDFVKDLPDQAALFRKPSLCRTALLPSESRYKGYSRPSTQQRNESSQFEMGVTRNQFYELGGRRAADRDSMLLVASDKKFQSCPSNENPIDSKDYYYATHNSGNVTLTLPNESEEIVYIENGQEEFQGLVVVCFFDCRTFDRCPNGNISRDDLSSQGQEAATMWVNGNLVTELTPMSSDCAILRGTHGHNWKPKDGKYELTVQVNKQIGSIRITSMILI